MIMGLLNAPQSIISIEFISSGAHDKFADGFVHRKTVPYTIVAQTLEGAYEIKTPHGQARAEAGEAFLVGANLPLAITHVAGRRGRCMGSRWMHLHCALFGTLDFTSFLEMPLRVVPPASKVFGAIIAELLHAPEHDPNEFYRLSRRQELGFKALTEICRLSSMKPEAEALLQNTERLLPALQHIKEHLGEPISVATLAARVHMSPSRFHAHFKRHMGRAPMEYVRTLRLAQARHRLLSTGAPVYEIAANTGFANPFHLSREFKRAFKLSPTDFRRKQGGMLV